MERTAKDNDMYAFRTDVSGNAPRMPSRCTEKGMKGRKNMLARFLLIVGCMRNMNDIRGSVLMEYIMVLTFVGAALALCSSRQFYSHSTGFGDLGVKFVGFFQRTMGGLALPVP